MCGRARAHQAASQQSGADEQHERRGQLADDEDALRAPPSAASRRPSAGPHRADRIVHERQSGRPREEQRHRRGDDEREGEHPAIEPDFPDTAREPRGVCDQEIEAGDRQTEAEQTAHHRQHEVFSEQLTAQER
jgi:hypothetical protein